MAEGKTMGRKDTGLNNWNTCHRCHISITKPPRKCKIYNDTSFKFPYDFKSSGKFPFSHALYTFPTLACTITHGVYGAIYEL